MMPSAKTVKRDRAPAREHVEQTQDAALLTLEQLLQLRRIDTRHGDMSPDSVYDQREKQESQTTLEVANLPPCAS